MIGKTIGHYRVLGRLGVGGMGIVYDAEDDRVPRRVALKVLAGETFDDPKAIRHLRREAEILAELNDPHICTIFEIGEADGRPFIAMERLDGRTLRVCIARKRLSTGEILGIAVQVAGALATAHDHNVVHRDIKPGNVFVSDAAFVKVLDFGLARRMPRMTDGGDASGSTIPGRPMGTANYMAPERILQMPLDGRCDLFSVGVMIYEMATGRLPFAASTPSQIVKNILDHEPVALEERAAHHPTELADIVNRLIAKRADDRFQSARELQSALLALQDRLARVV